MQINSLRMFAGLQLPLVGNVVQTKDGWHGFVKDTAGRSNYFLFSSKEQAEQEIKYVTDICNLLHSVLEISDLTEIEKVPALGVVEILAIHLLKERRYHKEFLDNLNSQLAVLGSKLDQLSIISGVVK